MDWWTALTQSKSLILWLSPKKKPLWYAMVVNEKDEVAIHYLDAKLVPVLLS